MERIVRTKSKGNLGAVAQLPGTTGQPVQMRGGARGKRILNKYKQHLKASIVVGDRQDPGDGKAGSQHQALQQQALPGRSAHTTVIFDGLNTIVSQLGILLFTWDLYNLIYS